MDRNMFQDGSKQDLSNSTWLIMDYINNSLPKYQIINSHTITTKEVMEVDMDTRCTHFTTTIVTIMLNKGLQIIFLIIILGKKTAQGYLINGISPDLCHLFTTPLLVPRTLPRPMVTVIPHGIRYMRQLV